MSITRIENINQACEASVNPQRVEEPVYFYGSPRLGMVLYSNAQKSIRKTAGIYALKFGGKTYKVATNSSGIVNVYDGECTAAVLPKRYISYMHGNNWDVTNNVALLKQQTDEMVAAGANFLHLTINYEYIFQSYSQVVANAPATWANYDDWFTHAASKNLPVGIRINMGQDDSLIPAFWGWDQHQRDEWGYEYRILYGSGQPSMSSSIGTNMLLDFFEKVVNRYSSLFGNNLVFIQPSTSGYQEFGGEITNYQFPNPYYPVCGDYSDVNIAAFRTAMQTKYGNITALKSAWGSVANAYTTFADVQAPRSPISNRYEASYNSVRAGLTGKRGEDWYKFNVDSYRAFFVNCYDIVKAINPNVQVSCCFGAAHIEHALSYFSYNIKDWARVSDNIQVWYSTVDATDQNDAMAVDWVKSQVSKPIMTEIADFDAGNYQNSLGFARKALDNGAFLVTIITNKSDLTKWEHYKTIIATLKAEYENQPIVYPTFTGSINVSWSEVVHNWYAVLEKWQQAGGSKTKHISINFTEDL